MHEDRLFCKWFATKSSFCRNCAIVATSVGVDADAQIPCGALAEQNTSLRCHTREILEVSVAYIHRLFCKWFATEISNLPFAETFIQMQMRMIPRGALAERKTSLRCHTKEICFRDLVRDRSQLISTRAYFFREGEGCGSGLQYSQNATSHF